MRTGEAAGPAENDRTLLRYEAKVEGGNVLACIESGLVYEDEQVDEQVADHDSRIPRCIDVAQGFVHLVAGERMAGAWNHLTAFVAGPPPMVDGALRMLVMEARLPASDIRYDKFT